MIATAVLVLLAPLARVSKNASSRKQDGNSAWSGLAAISQDGSAGIDRVDLWREDSYSGLPVASVKAYPVEGAAGTVFLVPQYHLDPSTQADDKRNDLAYKTQKEIYRIMRFMNERAGIDLAMIEGEMRGPVPSGKVDGWKRMVDSRNSLDGVTGKLRDVLAETTINESLESKVVQGLEGKNEKVNRRVMLSGATQVLVGEGGQVQVWGLENEGTIAASRPIIRDYVYLQDRIVQVSRGGSGKTAKDVSQGEKLALLAKLLGGSGSKNVPSSLDALKAQAQVQGNSEVSGLAAQAKEELGAWEAKTASGSKSYADLSRQTSNPYTGINSSRELKRRLAETEKQIKQIVIDQRNREAAENARYALAATGEEAGVVQFGSGHTEGLVQEMNRQGLSVVVVTPAAVAEKTYAELDRGN